MTRRFQGFLGGDGANLPAPWQAAGGMEPPLRFIRVAQTEDPGRRPVLPPGGEQGLRALSTVGPRGRPNSYLKVSNKVIDIRACFIRASFSDTLRARICGAMLLHKPIFAQVAQELSFLDIRMSWWSHQGASYGRESLEDRRADPIYRAHRRCPMNQQ